MILKCAVVGANGFLGRHLVKKLVEKNHHVTAVVNRSSTNLPADVQKFNIIDFLAKENCFDVVFVAIGNYQSTHEELIDINSTILHILKNNFLAKIVFISSTNVYGIHEDTITKNSSFNSPTLYPLSKLAGEFLVASHRKYVILRLTYLYGKGLDNKSFLPNTIKKAIETGKITIFGDGSRKQDYLHVDDAVELCIKAAETDKNGIYIGASGVSISNREVAEIISAKYSSTIQYTGDELGSSFNFDIKYTMDELNWFPKINLIDGLMDMIP